MNLKEKYSELISLTQLYILNECPVKEKAVVDQDTFHFFKNWIKSSKPLGNQKENSPPIPPSLPTQQTQLPPSTSTAQTKKIEIPSPSEITSPPSNSKTPAQLPASNPIKEPQKISSPIVDKKDNDSKPSSTLKSFELAPLPSYEQNELRILKNTVEKLLRPHQALDEIPSDQEAKKIKNGWNQEDNVPAIAILSFNDQEKHLSFLNNLAKAITITIAPARVIQAPAWEQKKKWDSFLKSPELRIVIASDYGLYLLPDLMKHYKEIPKTAKHLLHETPLLLLSDISLYLKEPQLKSLLWRTICTEFESIKRKKI